jgi:hypothetical protein
MSTIAGRHVFMNREELFVFTIFDLAEKVDIFDLSDLSDLGDSQVFAIGLEYLLPSCAFTFIRPLAFLSLKSGQLICLRHFFMTELMRGRQYFSSCRFALF